MQPRCGLHAACGMPCWVGLGEEEGPSPAVRLAASSRGALAGRVLLCVPRAHRDWMYV